MKHESHAERSRSIDNTTMLIIIDDPSTQDDDVIGFLINIKNYYKFYQI
jgi:hypothetical protein